MLARVRILPKILAIVGLLSAIAITLAWLGVSALGQLNAKAEVIANVSKRALLAARMNQNVIALNRAEFRSALDPRDDNRLAARKVIEEQLAQYQERFAEVAKTPDAKAKALLPAADEAFAAYRSQLQATLAAVDGEASAKLTDSAVKLRESAMKSRAAAEALLARVRAVADRLNVRAEESAQEARAEYDSVSRLLIIVAAAGVAAGLGLGFIVGQYGIAAPIRATVALLQQLAGGRYEIEITGAERRDEVGEVAKAAAVFKQNGLDKLRMEAEQKEIEQRSAAQRRADMLALADRFEGAVGEVIETVNSASTELEASADTLARGAERAQQVTTVVAAASEEASTNVQSVASATEELSSSVNEISRQVQESAHIAREAVDQARAANERVGELTKAAARIGDVVELITTIAGQTNLLALNATIEAARAGEAGRGFAVVATEVKALADQTAKATGEISQQIGGIQTATRESEEAIRGIGQTINRISEIASTIASAVEEQGAATQEISRNVQQAALGTRDVSTNIVDVQRGASETGAASSQVLTAAQSLARDSTVLKQQVGSFLQTIRAA
jgi:methyl-accepting chemotaxis protein